MNKEQNLISQYEDMCIRWGASKDPRKANILFDKIRKTEFELKQTEQGIQQLNIFPNEAEDTLEKLSKEHEHLGFSAEITLEEWRKGTLNVQ